MHGRYEALGAGVNITEFKYRMNGTATAQILFSVTVKTPQEVSDPVQSASVRHDRKLPNSSALWALSHHLCSWLEPLSGDSSRALNSRAATGVICE